MINPKKIRYALVMLCIALWGPLLRSCLDRLWMLDEGLVSVGKWAQLQTLIEFIGAPVSSGIAIGLTILIAQHRESEHRSILISAYMLSLITIIPLMILTVMYAHHLVNYIGLGTQYQSELVLCALVGYLSIGAILLNSFLIGRNQQARALLLMLASTIPPVMMLFAGNYFVWAHSLQAILYCMIVVGILIHSLLIVSFLNHRKTSQQDLCNIQKYSYRLARFIPAGISLGMLSPLSILIVRALITNDQGWDFTGHTIAIWRASDWVLSAAVSILYFHFLPQWSQAQLGDRLKQAIARTLLKLYLPCLLILCCLIAFRNPVMGLLYGERIILPLNIALYFWMGDAMRILAAFFVAGQFILHATKLITVLDFFSQPLFALLLFFGMTARLELTGIAFLGTYSLYALLCLVGLLYIESVKRKSE